MFAHAMGIVVAAIVVVALVALLRLPRIKGWFGERAVSHLGLRRLDRDCYTVIDDLILPRSDGRGTTQVDHVVVARTGIFVIETKDYSGRIYGREDDRRWTQVIGGKKHAFQNPLHQNNLHVKAIAKLLEVPSSVCRPVVFFIGSATFRPPVPAGVLQRGLLPWIHSHLEIVLSPEQVARATAVLRQAKATTDGREARVNHIAATRARTGRRA